MEDEALDGLLHDPDPQDQKRYESLAALFPHFDKELSRPGVNRWVLWGNFYVIYNPSSAEVHPKIDTGCIKIYPNPKKLKPLTVRSNIVIYKSSAKMTGPNHRCWSHGLPSYNISQLAKKPIKKPSIVSHNLSLGRKAISKNNCFIIIGP
jgi:hypothetical protein